MFEIELILVWFLGLIFGVWFGWRLCSRMHENLLPEILRMTGVTDEKLKEAMLRLRLELPENHPDKIQSLDETVPRVDMRIEQHMGVLYAYRKEDGQFMAQGRSQEELLNRMQEQNKGTPFKMIVLQEDGADLLQKNNAQIG